MRGGRPAAPASGAHGAHRPPGQTKTFWDAIARAGLPFAKRDRMGEILARGRITTREHYEYAVDMAGLARDEDGLSAAQEAQLSQMIGAYESRRSDAAIGRSARRGRRP